MLAYGRSEEAQPQRRVVALHMLVGDVGDLLGLDGSGPIEWVNAVDSRLEIHADPDQLLRVLLNLCRNAVQALESSRDPALVRRLSVTAEKAGDVIVIQVSDTGPGVPARAREKLFQAFQGSARAGGTGLGLAIAAELTRAHGGTIALIENGPGATFEVRLPLRGGARRTNGTHNGKVRVDAAPRDAGPA